MRKFTGFQEGDVVTLVNTNGYITRYGDLTCDHCHGTGQLQRHENLGGIVLLNGHEIY